MLTNEMKTLIENYRAGMVATVNDDGTPAVSPKATFVIVSDTEIAFGNIRSPGTLLNIRKRPAVEVNFIDVLSRTAVRIKGTATIVTKATASEELLAVMQRDWGDYLPHMSSFVSITISGAELILSPAYDLGISRAELMATNLDKLSKLS